MTQNTIPDQFRRIRSFSSQRNSMTTGQARAISELGPKWLIPYSDELLDFEAEFGRIAPTYLEIGFGMGETTEKICLSRPEHNFIGVEVFAAGVGAMLMRIRDSQLSNIKIIKEDAYLVLEKMIPLESLSGVHIFFPDPWHKKRHHKRRLIQKPFIDFLSQRIMSGGYIHCATDWEDYAHQMLDVLKSCNYLINQSMHEHGFSDKPDYRPQTKFETRGFRLGHESWDLIFKKH
ncbi:tRNA (guanosine(46)-N7)-methyltransferase TrmB [Taylorella equigenitalis]|uniref:tRNA (guanosine(46)-N7)-methyltransferase TrmB n=1 Tax=Taylorella equigenitalis TaxID=29575 RepID=UPI00041BA5E5|nr:tRNA (guanosine(46)-N7)-methyltransferase TrmB [Taylorella equigenitalis]WEE00713.1 tRNA (guanosine(46)-N7)-methyltransferase TrmB [Taylorella equigenitalis]WEE02190.1 tRNA (guanosine(46)-N7)-methyltransferase TrmB [Taylorella equigenitalis]WFD78726.1 tRNA (guanosine(46)-N7)-methyltransferase TrmB [Taylorella equigenitalis]WFD80204.1 tRNA (guanosine(46)-N7)-methyltransferase TrmB [Taylorella equigenitalis]WFD81681.1 tRNA (guanosine(46)-N7)-methyltransferase TrmB [Taylorella equigenitalis]